MTTGLYARRKTLPDSRSQRERTSRRALRSKIQAQAGKMMSAAGWLTRARAIQRAHQASEGPLDRRTARDSSHRPSVVKNGVKQLDHAMWLLTRMWTGLVASKAAARIAVRRPAHSRANI